MLLIGTLSLESKGRDRDFAPCFGASTKFGGLVEPPNLKWRFLPGPLNTGEIEFVPPIVCIVYGSVLNVPFVEATAASAQLESLLALPYCVDATSVGLHPVDSCMAL